LAQEPKEFTLDCDGDDLEDELDELEDNLVKTTNQY